MCVYVLKISCVTFSVTSGDFFNLLTENVLLSVYLFARIILLDCANGFWIVTLNT